MNKKEIKKIEEQKDNEKLWELCNEVYQELKAIDIPVQMPKEVTYSHLKKRWGSM